LFSALIASCAHFAHAQADSSQLGFSALQAQANVLVGQGKLTEAKPLLLELVQRVQASETPDESMRLDFPYFLIGTAHIQAFVNSGDKSQLEGCLEWYAKLEAEYSDSIKMKEMVFKRIDVYRALEQETNAIEEMKKILSGGYPGMRIRFANRIKLLKDITQVHYAKNLLQEGLPFFKMLMEESRDPEDSALAAAASFEAYFSTKDLDKAIERLPMLVRESDVRYRPRLNVALLKASDVLVEANRLNDAALTLNLIKTTDLMIKFHENKAEDIRARMELRQTLQNISVEDVESMQQQIKTLEANIVELKKLPTLRNELLVRRARNYTKTARSFEAFWMFFDLMVENPEDEQAEFYTYASFSNAIKVGKSGTAIEIGKDYRARFPDGDYFSDVTGALALLLKEGGFNEEFIELAVGFLGTHPQDAVSRSLFAEWAGFLIEKERYRELIKQAAEWYNAHPKSIYEDGIFYWGGLAELQLNQFEDAVGSFTRLLDQYPTSVYAEDGLLRKGAAEYYAQFFETAHTSLHAYLDTYPAGRSRDQAHFFLGEIEFLAEHYETALKHFYEADKITVTQDVHDGAAFRIGAVLETMKRYEDMVTHFEQYIDRFGELGDLTRAVLQLGRAFEFLMRPVDMLALYRKNIEIFASDPNNIGVDSLIENYAQKFNKNFDMLTTTVAFFDKIRDDTEYRTQIVTDRGFLFEAFYNDRTLYPALYNDLRQNPDFKQDLLEDLSPLQSVMAPFKEQLALFPKETPEDYFRDQLAQARAKKAYFSEIRMLMGLYRLDIELAPSEPYDSELVAQLSPLMMLYVADFERNKRLPFAEEIWNTLLSDYPTDDEAIVALMRLADVNAERENYSKAKDCLEKIIQQFPGSPKAPAVRLRKGELLSKMGNGGLAREEYQYILRVPDWRGVIHARALYQTGQSYLAEGANAEAHGFFERTFLAYPHLTKWSARAYLGDVDALIAMGKKADAISTLNEAIKELTGKASGELIEQIQSKLRELQ
ncbi:tetratricopeptide repeat protein, partial [bacterium]|nr:tetratricopeptide repeat protein [bacterium]